MHSEDFSGIMACMSKKDAHTEEAENRLYELGYLFVSAIPEEKLTAEVVGLKEIITKQGGIVQTSADPSLRDLAYPMSISREHKKTTYTAGYFGWVVFEGSAETALAVDAAAKKNDIVLRYILIKRPPLNVNASVKSQAPGVGARKGAKKKTDVVNEEEIDKSIDELVEEKIET